MTEEVKKMDNKVVEAVGEVALDIVKKPVEEANKVVKSPLQIYREEAAETDRVKKEFTDKYQSAKLAATAKRKEVAGKLKNLKDTLNKDIATQFKPSLDAVEKLTASANKQRKIIAQMEAKLAAAKKEYGETNKNLRKADQAFSLDTQPLNKIYKINLTNIEQTGAIEIATAGRKESNCKRNLNKALSAQRKSTFSHTLKGTLSYLFNIPVAIYRAASELVGGISLPFNSRSKPFLKKKEAKKKQEVKLPSAKIATPAAKK